MARDEDLSIVCILYHVCVRSVKAKVVDVNRKQQGSERRPLKNSVTDGSQGRSMLARDRHALRVSGEIISEPFCIDFIKLQFLDQF